MRSKTQFRDSGKNQLEVRFRLSPRRTPTFAETQRTRILRLLIDACGAWVPSPKIMAFAAQYSARILELLWMGFSVENRTERVDGARHSWFRLVSSPAPKPEPTKPAPIWAPRTTDLLFDLEPRP